MQVAVNGINGPRGMGASWYCSIPGINLTDDCERQFRAEHPLGVPGGVSTDAIIRDQSGYGPAASAETRQAGEQMARDAALADLRAAQAAGRGSEIPLCDSGYKWDVARQTCAREAPIDLQTYALAGLGAVVFFMMMKQH